MSPQARSVSPMVVRGSSLPRQSVHGNPALSKQVLLSNFAGGNLIGMSVAYHPKGEECGPHAHRGMVETFYVLSGVGTIVVDGTCYVVGRGDCVMVPPGAVHNLIGSGGGSFEVLCVAVVAPGHESDPEPWKQ